MTRTVDRSTQTDHVPPTPEALRWRRRIRIASVGATLAGITVMGSLMLTSHQEASAATLASASAVPVAVGSDDAAPTGAPAMPQDMPGMDMSGSSPAPSAPAMPQDMPGMDMSGSSTAPSAPAMPQDMPGMDMSGSSSGAAAHRPLAPVLGTFGGATAAVLFTAGMLRRKDLDLSLAKKTSRIAGRAGK